MSSIWPPQYNRDYVPQKNAQYWDKELETMEPGQREEHVIWPKLQAQLHYVYQNSKFYKEKWDAAGIKPSDIASLQDFQQLPFVTKQDLRQEQLKNPPFGTYLCVGDHALARIHGTSGTTGRPTAFGISKPDMQRISEAHARIMWSFGVRQKDIVFIASFFSLYWGSWGALAGTERLGAAAFPFGAGVSGQSDRALDWILETQPTVFYGTPSYALYLAEKAKNRGLEPKKDFNFKILFFSGEPGAGVPSTKARIEDVYGGICVDSGSTGEMSPWMTNSECAYRTGMHLWQDIVYAELVNPNTLKPVPYGQEGAIVYTHLERNSQPMIRFWAGDLAQWTNEPCPCGRTYPRLPWGIYGRTDDMLVIRGENVYPSAIEDCLRSFPELGDEYRIVVLREQAMDELIIQVEHASHTDSSRLPQLQTEIGQTMQAKGLRAKIEIVAPNTFERTEFKAKRVVDQR